MSGKKKLLFVSARLPFPAVEGHQIRTFGVLKELSKDYEIHLLSLLREGEEINLDDELGRACESITGVAIPKGVAHLLHSAITSVVKALPLVVCKYVFPSLIDEFSKCQAEISPDVIHLDLLPLAQLSRSVVGNIPVVLNEHNVESALIAQKLQTVDSTIEKLIYGREYRLLKKFESEICTEVSTVLACSDKDAELLKNMGARSVHCIPNGVDVTRFEPDYTKLDSNHLVFLGGMGWYPNRLGVQWFVNEVLPLIISKNPKVKLDLVGNPEPKIYLSDEVKNNVIIHGFVDDFRPIVNQAAIMIVPLHVGSGTRLKVVEAAALGKCMVSTSKGAEGVMLKADEQIIFADDARDFSEAILDVCHNKDKIISIGSGARIVAETIYDWGVIGIQLNEIYGALHGR